MKHPMIRSRRVRYGSMTVYLTVTLIAALVLFNVIFYALAGYYGWYVDMTPEKVYSIRNKVQGICFTPDGKVMMSTSYGLADSVYYVYNEADAVDSGKTLDGAPLYYLCETTQVMKGPAMSEDLECKNGKIYTMTESASDKYIFGKFFFANKIIAFDTDDLK